MSGIIKETREYIHKLYVAKLDEIEIYAGETMKEAHYLKEALRIIDKEIEGGGYE